MNKLLRCKGLFLSLSFLLPVLLFAQPANNTCNASSPEVFSEGTCRVTSGTVANATRDGSATNCAGTVRYDVWYRFVAQSTNPTISLSNLGANFTSPGLQVLSGSCAGTTLFCTNGTSVTTTGLVVNNTYYVRVFSTAPSTPSVNASFDICITDPSPRSNDLCTNATDLTVHPNYSPTTGDLYLASRTNPAAGCGNRYDVWYKFTVPASVSTVTISAILTSATTTLTTGNTYIEVYGYNAAGCTIDNNSSSCNNISTSRILTGLTPNATYYFRISTTLNPSAAPANWAFNVSVFLNNTCDNAVGLTTGNPVTGTMVGSNADAVATCNGTVRYDVWYKFVATSTNPTITLSSIGSNFHNTPNHPNESRARLQLLTGCGAGASITCGGTALTGSGLTVGNTYYVRVYSITSTGLPTTNAGFTVLVDDPGPLHSSRMNEVFLQTTLSGTNLINDPWEVTYGPDNFLWISEAKGYQVYRMDPATGQKSTILELYPTATQHPTFNRANTQIGQGGLAGLALHPDWANKKYVYVSYIYSYQGETNGKGNGVFYTNRIVRFEYDPGNQKLINPISLCDTLPGSGDHNSQRMIIAPVDGIDYLFYASGDMGAGQFGNASRPIKSQFTGSYEGKILRFNLEPDGDAGTLDRWIPNDNPFNTVSPAKQNAVWATGIRNNQGFAFGNGKLYGSSHGAYSDDEINIVEKKKNYGHPLVQGYADGNYNGSKAGHDWVDGGVTYPTSMQPIVNEVTVAAGLTDYADPIFSGYAAPMSTVNSIWSNPVNNGAWPSEGWSGMDFYNHPHIPGWKNSLVLGSLKWGRVLRFKLNEDGSDVIPTGGSDTLSYFGSTNRFRDMAIAPNGKDIYIVMDKSETTSGPSALNPKVSACNGCVQKYTFLGYNDDAGQSTLPAAIPVQSGTNNSCNTGTTVTVDATNNNLWVPITGSDGNIIAEVYANNQNIGALQSSFYTTSSVRNTGSRRFLGRNIFIDPAAALTNIKVRIYVTKAEFDTWKPTGGSVIGEIRVFQNNNSCRSFPLGAMVNNNPPAPTHALMRSGTDVDGYVVQVNNINIPAAGASFYLANAGTFILPVDLLTFTGSLQNNNDAHLKWTTENESNTVRYGLERSLDGINYTDIGEVAATGQGSQRERYNYFDRNVHSLGVKTLYYRLRIIDRDGSARYSNVATISLTDASLLVSVTPNPVNNVAQLRVKGLVDGIVNWQLFDGGGRNVTSGQLRVNRSVPTAVDIDMQTLAQGAYFIQVSGAGLDTKIKVQKL